jgi:23S rRNA (uracil1939-C5)-methyltransferase
MKLTVEKLIPGGSGLGRSETGQVVFVPGVLPGEDIICNPVEHKRDFIRAELAEVLEPSEFRVNPPCPLAGVCGGCDFQHISYAYQAELKRLFIKEALERTGGFDAQKIDVGMQADWQQGEAYRIRSKFHVDPETRSAGFLSAKSDRVVPVDYCLVLDPRLQRRFELERDRWTDRSIPMVAGNRQAGLFDEQVSLTLSPSKLDAHTFNIDARVFFQSNQRMFELLLDDIIAPLPSGKDAMDLFAGVGTFSAFLTGFFEHITAVERDKRCLSFAQSHLDTDKVSFHTQPVERWKNRNGSPELIILDPPRTGIPGKALGWLAESRADMIIYVSCNPVTLARDLSKLCGSGGYGIRYISGYDFYPHTSHVEVAAILTKI